MRASSFFFFRFFIRFQLLKAERKIKLQNSFDSFDRLIDDCINKVRCNLFEMGELHPAKLLIRY